MDNRTLAEVRAADADILYSLYFPERVPAAAVVGCVCLDHLTCTECERILGVSFLAIELAARKKQRTDPPVLNLVARVDAGPGQGLTPVSHRVVGPDAAVCGMAARKKQRTDDPPVVVARVDTGPGQGLAPVSHRVVGPDEAVCGMAARVVPGSHPPSDVVEGSDAAFSSTEDRLGTGSHPPSEGVKGSDAAISSVAVPLGPGSNSGVVGFEAAISGMAARLGLAATVAERAKEVYRKMDEAKAWPRGRRRGKDRSSKDHRSKERGPLAYAACLSIACRADGSALSLRELAQAVAVDGSTATRGHIARLTAHIRSQLGEEAGLSTGIGMVCVSVSTYVRRFGALVGLHEAELAAALKAARRLEDGVLVVRHSADIVAAAVVNMARQRARAIRSGAKDVAAATGASHMTIYAACRELRPHADLLFG